MTRGTNPKWERTYPKLLTFCEAAFWQNGDPIVVTPEVEATNNGCLITITLTQEQTLSLDLGVVFWQIRGICSDGAVASDVYTEIVTDVHPDGVISAPVSLGFGLSAPSEEPEEEPVEESEENEEETDEE